MMKNYIHKLICIFLILICIGVIYYNYECRYTIKYTSNDNYKDYLISDDNNYFQINDYYVNNNDNVISRIKNGTKVSELIDEATYSNATVKVKNKSGIDKSNTDKVYTGDILNITFTNGLTPSVNYKLSVYGDTVGEGEISSEGNKKIARHIIDGNVITENEYILAADYNDDGMIKMNDVIMSMEGIEVTNNKSKLTATFVLQDEDAATMSISRVTCYLESNANSCQITVPVLTANSGYTVYGFNTDKDAHTATVAIESKIVLTNDITYYSITKNNTEYTATFNLKDTAAGSISGNTTDTCQIYNGNDTCEVTAPTINLNNGYSMVGWTTISDSTNSETNDGVNISDDTSFYSITSKVITITFDKNTTYDNNEVAEGEEGYEYYKSNIEADSLEYYEDTCISYNNQGCYLDNFPKIYSAGNEIIGYCTSSQQGKSSTTEVLKVKYTSDITYYARIYNNITKNTFSLGYSTEVGNVTVEFESVLDANLVLEYDEYINQLYEDIPALFDMKGKLRILSNDTYVEYRNSTTGGVTSGFPYSSDVTIRTHDNVVVYEYDKATIAHELSHALDRFYATMTRDYKNNLIRNKEDLVELYNTYKEEQSGERPLNDYSYSSSGEFWANAVASYYGENFDNLDMTAAMANKPEYRPITADITQVVEKYLCIANNGYNEAAECPSVAE